MRGPLDVGILDMRECPKKMEPSLGVHMAGVTYYDLFLGPVFMETPICEFHDALAQGSSYKTSRSLSASVLDHLDTDIVLLTPSPMEATTQS